MSGDSTHKDDTFDNARRDGAFRPVRHGPSTAHPVRSTRPRLHAFDYKGEYAYHVTMRTREAKPVFVHREQGAHVLKTLQDTSSHQGFALLACCLMPDHLHVLCQGMKADSDLKAFVHRLKQLTSFAYKRATGQPLWQTSYFDRVLRRDEDLQTVADYIFANPVKAGLVDDASSYALSGGVYFTRDRADGPEGAVPTNNHTARPNSPLQGAWNHEPA